MNLHEYQSKQVFARHGIPIPEGEVASTPEEAQRIAERLGGPVAVKAQVLVGGRGKAGGIRLARDPQEARQVAEAILAMEIKGLPVRRVLVERATEIAQEIYLGFVVDRAAARVTMMASPAGGVDIEEVARETPEKIFRAEAHPYLGLRAYQARAVGYAMGLPREQVGAFASVAMSLYQTFVDCDASLAEINPLVVTGDGRLMALDAKIVLDDNALFRHPDLAALRDVEAENPLERQAREYGLSYVHLDGNIGCMVNGAGLAMATMDIIKLYGGEPANFLDIGGGAKASQVEAALRIILADPKVEAILLNIFGGITRCDEVARGILAAMEQVQVDVPMVARLVGTNEEEGRALLASANLMTATTLVEAAQKAVAAAQGRA
ncbi:MAG: ADP-forming succinate--CoA ligase subunit beta [Anaerolineae bacterium]|nr:ADP-forming succinate--CoA ligase subunit beta [Anaerolineae bacterium]